MNATALKNRLDEAEVIDIEPPRPLRRPMRSAEQYPVDALGPIIARAVNACQSIIQAPVEICAQSALSMAAVAAQPHADIVLPTGSACPISLFLVSIAGSGDRKSAADKVLGWALERRERVLADDSVQAIADYQNDKRAWDKARDMAVNAIKSPDRKQIASALDDVGAEPKAPRQTTISFPDPTLEGLQKYLAVGQSSVAVLSDEGGQFVGGTGMSKENMLRTGAGYSKFWDGAPVKRLRSGDGRLVLFGRRVSMHLMIQPRAASEWLADPVLRDQGFFSRLLIAAPPSLAGTRLYREPNVDARGSIDAFGARLLSLFEQPYPMREGGDGELAPRQLGMTDQAKAMWRGFADSIERELGEKGKLVVVKGLANKIPEHAARLAAVLAIFDDPAVEGIDEHALKRGILLAQWYLGEALRLAEVGEVSEDVRLAEALLSWLRDVWPNRTDDGGRLVSPPDVYQFGPGAIREKAVAERALKVLHEHGWLVKLDGSHRVNGARRRDVYAMREA